MYGLLANKIIHGFQNCTLRVQRYNLTNFIFLWKPLFKKNWISGDKTCAGLSKVQTSCPQEPYEYKHFIRNQNVFKFFLQRSARKFSDFNKHFEQHFWDSIPLVRMNIMRIVDFF